MVGINMDRLQWFINFLIKKTSGGIVKNQIISNKELVEELQKPITRKPEKRKVHAPFKGSILDTDLADMKLISKFNEGFRFLLYFIDIYSKIYMVNSFKRLKKELQLRRLSKKF